MDPYPPAVGRYVITGLLGRGGMGVVLLGHDPELDREVAIKLLDVRQIGNAEAQSRFIREARVLARLSEPHIVQVHDFLTEGPTPALVMERLRGRTLREIISTGGPQPLQRVLDCAWQVLRGLAAAHAAGIVHRDIKPSNLMLVEGGLYKLVDFGLADVADGGDLTASGDVMGTFRYLPPERRRGVEAGPPGDLWSLGVTLIEMATGERPTADGQPSCSFPGATPAVSAWLARMVAPDPVSRFPTAAQALQALAAAMPDLDRAPLVASDSSHHAPVPAELPTSRSLGSPSSRITGTVRPLRSLSRPLHVPAPENQRVRIPFVIKLITTIWIISTAATLLAGWAISSHAIATQEARLRNNLASVAASASLLVDPALHLRQSVHPDATDPALLRQRETLRSYANFHSEIRYIYTLSALPETPTTGVVQFVCDGSDEKDSNGNGVIDPDEAIAEPGQRYPARDWPDLLLGFEAPVTDREARSDQWGSWISGYAPIRDAAGTSIGLVAVDVPAAHIRGLREDFLIHSLVLLGSTLVAFLAAGALVAFRLRRPVAELQRGMAAVARGELDVEIQVKSQDEFQALAESFENMRQELRRGAAIRQAFEGFVTRSLDGQSSNVTDLGGARLYVHLQAKDGRAEGVADRLAAAMPRIFHHAQVHGGMPERVVGGGVSIGFATADAGDLPQERAVRAALGMLADLEHGPGSLDLAIGVATGADATTRARELGQAGADHGLDLLVRISDFAPIRPAFYADRCMLPGIGEVVAVKGAVSG